MPHGIIFAIFRESGKVSELEKRLIRDARPCAIRVTEKLARLGSKPSQSAMWETFIVLEIEINSELIKILSLRQNLLNIFGSPNCLK